ncbi:MAG: hypothetical protein HYR55_06230 [Acidobacteria bacterium]|nr:hypothetical protein [Acidobacteriota bacterium]MBI3657137.1 hypothetical protein [Acidobacteriota bacterium]
METLVDNLCRWDGVGAGHYEVWYCTMNHRSSGCGFWFRYTMEAPLSVQAPRRGELWALFFDPARPSSHIAIKESFPIEQFRKGAGEDSIVQIGNHGFGVNFLRGAAADADHEMTWDLGFQPSPTTYHHIPSLLRAALPLKSLVCSPNLDVRFRGTVRVDGRAFDFQNEPGCQSHLWGKKHAEAWLWLHCNNFADGADTVVEALAARPKILGWTLPLTSSVYVRHQGKEYRFNSLQVKNEPAAGQWRFTAANSQIRVQGLAQCSSERFVQVTYHDPDGEPCYCCNSEIADFSLELSLKGLTPSSSTAQARGGAHFEIASRTPNSAVPIYIK